MAGQRDMMQRERGCGRPDGYDAERERVWQAREWVHAQSVLGSQLTPDAGW